MPLATTQLADPVLQRFRDRVVVAFGHRLERAILFGSRAQGDARKDSDYDIAVFLREPERHGVTDQISTIASDIMDETASLISVRSFQPGA